MRCVVNGLGLGAHVQVRMENKLNFPMRCEYVRKICSGADVPEVLRFIHSSFDIPVHYDVYTEYAGLFEF